MIPALNEISQMLSSNSVVADFYDALTNKSFIDGLFHYLLVDLQSGEIFTHQSANPLPHFPSLSFLAAVSPSQAEAAGWSSRLAGKGAFLASCLEAYQASVERGYGSEIGMSGLSV